MVEEHRATPEDRIVPRSRRAALRATGGGLAVATATLLVRPAPAQTEKLPDVVAEFHAAWETFIPTESPPPSPKTASAKTSPPG